MNPEEIPTTEGEEEKDYTGRGWIVTGLLLIFAAILFASYNFLISREAGIAAQEALEELQELRAEEMESLEVEESSAEPQEEELPLYRLNPFIEMPIKTIDNYDYIGTLEIPSLNLNLPILSEWDYVRLDIAPCRYEGSVYQDNLILCAHNYDTHFGTLKYLHPGDEIKFTDMDGNEFLYEVTELETLQPDQVDYLKGGYWDLTLFTCTIGGATRVTVRCERISE